MGTEYPFGGVQESPLLCGRPDAAWPCRRIARPERLFEIRKADLIFFRNIGRAQTCFGEKTFAVPIADVGFLSLRAGQDEPPAARALVQCVLLSRSQARLLQLAAAKKTDFVLNLKAATGYTAALLARMSMAVVALESDSGLCDVAQERFIEMEIDNAAVLNINPEAGFPSQAPYNLIFIDGIVPNIPETLTDQLAEGGSLVCVTVKPFSPEGKATKVSKNNGVLSYLNAFDVALDDFIRPRIDKNFIFESVS